MALTLSHTFVIVDDQDSALAFYTDVLGLEVRIDAPVGDLRWLTVGSPAQPELEIALDQAYGVRDCAFRDPAGNHLRFAQPRQH